MPLTIDLSLAYLITCRRAIGKHRDFVIGLAAYFEVKCAINSSNEVCHQLLVLISCSWCCLPEAVHLILFSLSSLGVCIVC